jgi:hypothetical protein
MKDEVQTMRTSLRTLAIGASLALPLALATPAFAAPPDATATPAAAGATSSDTLSGAIRGRGTLSLSGESSTMTFRIAAHAETGEHGRHGDFRVDESGGIRYNGAIHSYTVSGSTATISGAGGLVDDQGKRRHVQFSATVTAGGAGTGAIDVTFTGKGYNDHYSGTVSQGQISIQA